MDHKDDASKYTKKLFKHYESLPLINFGPKLPFYPFTDKNASTFYDELTDFNPAIFDSLVTKMKDQVARKFEVELMRPIWKERMICHCEFPFWTEDDKRIPRCQVCKKIVTKKEA